MRKAPGEFVVDIESYSGDADSKFKPTKMMRQFGEVLMPGDAEPPILSVDVRASVHEWMVEIGAAEELAAVKLKPRRSCLMFGPPGCGKTTLGHHFSARLGLPMLVVNTGAIVAPYVGATENNLYALFAEVNQQADKCILFMDEFDALVPARKDYGTSAGVGYNNTVIAVLQQMDLFRGTLLAATNRMDGIDAAVWRRFGLQIDISEPGDDERFAILKRYLAPFTLPDDSFDMLVNLTAGSSPALLRGLMEGIKRAIVLNERLKRSTEIWPVMFTILTNVRPHPDAKMQPTLWRDREETRKQLAKMSWPPTLEA